MVALAIFFEFEEDKDMNIRAPVSSDRRPHAGTELEKEIRHVVRLPQHAINESQARAIGTHLDLPVLKLRESEAHKKIKLLGSLAARHERLYALLSVNNDIDKESLCQTGLFGMAIGVGLDSPLTREELLETRLVQAAVAKREEQQLVKPEEYAQVVLDVMLRRDVHRYGKAAAALSVSFAGQKIDY